jgi:hypothetical protein
MLHLSLCVCDSVPSGSPFSSDDSGAHDADSCANITAHNGGLSSQHINTVTSPVNCLLSLIGTSLPTRNKSSFSPNPLDGIRLPPPPSVCPQQDENRDWIGDVLFLFIFALASRETDGSAPAELISDFRCLLVGRLSNAAASLLLTNKNDFQFSRSGQQKSEFR